MNKSEYGLITDMPWHSSGRWLAYAKPAGVYVQNIRLYDAAGGRTYDVTNPTAYDYSPSFDPEGRFLYFLSRRALNPSMDPVQFVYSFAKPSKPYLVALRRGDSFPFIVYKKAEGDPGDVDVEGSSCGWSPSPWTRGSTPPW